MKISLKRWYLFPIVLYGIFLTFWVLLPNAYIYPSTFGEGKAVLNSKSYKLIVTSKKSRYDTGCFNTYRLTTEPKGLLNELYTIQTEELFSPPGVIWGNFDWDLEKEILILAESKPSQTAVLNSEGKSNYHEEVGVDFSGIYDYEKGFFRFIPLKSSPFRRYILAEILDPFTSLINVLAGLLAGFTTGVLFVLDFILRWIKNRKHKKIANSN